VQRAADAPLLVGGELGRTGEVDGAQPARPLAARLVAARAQRHRTRLGEHLLDLVRVQEAAHPITSPSRDRAITGRDAPATSAGRAAEAPASAGMSCSSRPPATRTVTVMSQSSPSRTLTVRPLSPPVERA